jgi:hypothetical protein
VNVNKNICYVIMPYGGDDPVKQGHYTAVYQLLIKTPAEQCGFEVKIEKASPDAVDIPKSISQHLACDELVIADVSELNWNVAYELGLRHALAKGSTILLCNKSTQKQQRFFDIETKRMIPYNGDDMNTLMSELESVQRAVKNAILAHKEQMEHNAILSGNSLHDAYPEFADFMVEYLNTGDESRLQIEELTRQLEACKKENAELSQQILKAGLSKNTMQESIHSSIKRALNNMQYSGTALIGTLRNLLSEDNPDYERIGEILEKGLMEGHLTEANFRSLYQIFKGAGIPQLTGLVLEIAAQNYPKSLDFKSYLADVYSDSYQTYDKALLYANEVLEVSFDPQTNQWKTDCRNIDSDQLAGCLNAYIGLDRYDILGTVCRQLIEQIPQHTSLLLRNLSVAYRHQGNFEEEGKTLQRLIKEFPMEDQTHSLVSQYYIWKGDYAQGYRQMELASALDPEDTNYLIFLAGFVLDGRLFRKGEDLARNVSDREELLRAAVPFLMQAFLKSPIQATLIRCEEFLLRNSTKKYANKLMDWIQKGATPFGIEELNYDSVRYIIGLSTNYDEALYNQF